MTVLDDHLLAVLGPDALGPSIDERSSHPDIAQGVPAFVFRAMSEEHFRLSLRSGWHASDERGNYIGQAAAHPRLWAGQPAPQPEGTVAGRWALPGYLTASPDLTGRVVKISADAADGWTLHPDDDEGVYVRTFQPVAAGAFVGWSARIHARGWKVMRGSSPRVHRVALAAAARLAA